MNERSLTMRAISGLLAGCCLLVMLPETMPAKAADAADPATSARQSLEKGRFPWYDAQQDRLKPIQLPAPTPKRKLPELYLPELRYVFLTILGLVLAGLVAGLILALYRRGATTGGRGLIPGPPETQKSAVAP